MELLNGLRIWWGYVDDCAGFFEGTAEALEVFKRQLQEVDGDQFEWVFEQSQDRIPFLDLDIQIRNHRLETKTFAKPNHQPQLLHASSMHPESMKKHLYKGQCKRYLLNCDQEVDGWSFCESLRATLIERGYPRTWLRDTPKFDWAQRKSMLQKLEDRRRCGGADQVYNLLAFVCTWSPGLARFKFSSAFSDLVGRLDGIVSAVQIQNLRAARFLVAWKVDSNMFLQSYSCNFCEKSR